MACKQIWVLCVFLLYSNVFMICLVIYNIFLKSVVLFLFKI